MNVSVTRQTISISHLEHQSQHKLGLASLLPVQVAVRNQKPIPIIAASALARRRDAIIRATGVILVKKADTSNSPTTFNDLPVEIIAEIFLVCHARHNISHFPWVQVVSKEPLPPISLSQVSRLWRAICLGFPELWTSPKLPYTAHKPSHAVALAHWLSKSRGCPLNVNAISNKPFLSGVDSALLSQMSRWKTVCMSEIGGLLPGFLSAHQTETPILEGLVLRLYPGKPLSQIFDQIVPRLQQTTSLRQLDLRFAGFMPNRDALVQFFAGVPFERLTHVRVSRNPSLDDFVSILQRCRSATHVELTSIIYEPIGLLPNKICLPALQSLTIHTEVPIATALQNFILPSLRTLRIVFEYTRLREPEAIAPLLGEEFVRSSALEYIFVVDYKGSLAHARGYLDAAYMRSIAHVEVKIHGTHSISVLREGGNQCPHPNCNRAHIGWSAFNDCQHIGHQIPDTEFSGPFWYSPYNYFELGRF
ncbi:hypothetical protein FA15DRAFT_609573 [Coprinopsis marcescibilis]|uniref:Uncharacterized protein n=1 Tax=Coprinopsis marcescibilis TaxID=230819 RepID=A0A5C3LA88_COPMA|nr:hypothetical protein FA15DRAFT_609573 [Coprinopsis marcescibilis]